MRLFNQFIYAAVKQVGRDRGKVISNKIYGNLHTSNVRIVDENRQFNSFKDVYSYADQDLEEGNFLYNGTKYFKLLFGHWLWLIVFVSVHFLGLIGSLIFAYKTFLAKHFQSETALIWKSIQIKDSRKKEGYREISILTPDNSKQKIYQLEIPKANKIYSILEVIISTATTMIIVWIIKTAK